MGQIAQQTFNYTREDGSARAVRFTISQDGATGSYNIPIDHSRGIIIQHGDAQDSPVEAIKTSQAIFTLTGVNEPLIDAIIGAERQEIQVLIEDTALGITYFNGWVTKGLEPRPMFGDVRSIEVRCGHGFGDLETVLMRDTGALFTIDGIADLLGTNLGIDRPLDLYTSMYHDGLSTSNAFPINVRVDLNGNNTTIFDYNLSAYKLLEELMIGLGFQCMVIGDRLVMADPWDRFNDSASINKHEDQGAGSYTNTTENIEISIGAADIVENSEIEEYLGVREYKQAIRLISRTGIEWDDSSLPDTLTNDGSTIEYSPTSGMVIGGDIINYSADGQLVSTSNGIAGGTYQYLGIRLDEINSDDVWWYNPTTQEWVKNTEHKFSGSFSFSATGTPETDNWAESGTLPAVPDGVIAELTLIFALDITFSSGDMSDIARNEIDNSDVSISGLSERNINIEQVFTAKANPAVHGRVVKRYTQFTSIGDSGIPDYTTDQAIQYRDGSWQKSTAWAVAGSLPAKHLGHVVAIKTGKILCNSADGFNFIIQDSIRPTSLSVLKITDRDSTVRTAFPLEIKHDLSTGFISIVSKEIVNNLSFTDLGEFIL